MKLNFKIDDVKYTNLLFKDSDENYCKINLTLKELSDEIKATCKINNNLKIKSKQDIILSIVCSDGLYVIKTRIKSLEVDEPYMFFTFEPVESIEHHQKREYFRVPVLYQCSFVARCENEMQDLTAKTFDLSANGISLFIPPNIDFKNITNLELYIENNSIKIKVKYVRSVKLETGYKASYYFDAISDSDRDFISQICLKKQLEERRNFLK